MEFANSYFEDEVREGFYVPAMVKRAWTAELEVLSEIDRICCKYDIPYFADWGTFLGIVRHGGFIPWDDDLDICMRRKDYKRFLEVAEYELKDEYKVFTFRTHPDFWYFLTRVVAKNRICFEEDHLRKYHQFPYIVGVDIFVLDYVPRDAEKEEYRNKAARYAIEVADEICTKELSEEETEQYLSIVEKICSIKIPRELISRKHDLRVYLYDIAERLFDAFDEEESDKLTRMMPEGLYNKRMRLKKEYYDDIIRLPFENTTIPVPMAYDEMLRERYGDYMKMVKNAGGHDYPFFETQQKQLDEVMAKEGIVFPKFTFSKESLVRPENDKSNSCKVLAIDLKNQLEEQYMQLQDAFDKSDYDKASEILVNSQQSAIDLGTIIENCKGEGGKTVALLQD